MKMITWLLVILSRCLARITYKFGAKCEVSADTYNVSQLDCSGWVRYLLAKASYGLLILPDGSQAQLEWVAEQGWHRLAKYSDISATVDDKSRLFIAFLTPASDGIGHVWLVHKGQTIEMHGPEGTPMGRRDWNTQVLMRCKDCFEVPVGKYS